MASSGGFLGVKFPATYPTLKARSFVVPHLARVFSLLAFGYPRFSDKFLQLGFRLATESH